MNPQKQQYQPKKYSEPRVINLEHGKVPPHSAEIEEAVLGAMMIDARGVDECLMIIKTSDVFYLEKHRVIYDAIAALYADGHPVDMHTVAQKLTQQETFDTAGGYVALIELQQNMASSAHIEVHSRIIQQYYIKRQIIKRSWQMAATAFDDSKDSLELLREWSECLDEITENTMTGHRGITYAEGLDLVEKRVEFLTNKKEEEVTGAHTGFNVIDQFTGGYQSTELIVVAARPGMGKTSYMLKCAIDNAKAGAAVGILSAEMSAIQLIARTVAIDTDFHLTQLTKKGFEKPEYFQKLSAHKHRMKSFPVYIDDMPSPDIRHVQATARLWKRKHNIKILIVDYLQLLGDATKAGNREQEIAAISRKLKGLAKELDIPVIALSQLSRATESRGSSKRPQLSDLRESGAIEQDADMVQFIFRPEYYNMEVDDELAAQNANSEIIFAKYRGGAPGTSIGLYWQGDKTKFMDPEEHMRNVEEANARAAHYESKPLPNVNPADAFGPVNNTNDDKDVPF